MTKAMFIVLRESGARVTYGRKVRQRWDSPKEIRPGKRRMERQREGKVAQGQGCTTNL